MEKGKKGKKAGKKVEEVPEEVPEEETEDETETDSDSEDDEDFEAPEDAGSDSESESDSDGEDGAEVVDEDPIDENEHEPDRERVRQVLVQDPDENLPTTALREMGHACGIGTISGKTTQAVQNHVLELVRAMVLACVALARGAKRVTIKGQDAKEAYEVVCGKRLLVDLETLELPKAKESGEKKAKTTEDTRIKAFEKAFPAKDLTGLSDEARQKAYRARMLKKVLYYMKCSNQPFTALASIKRIVKHMLKNTDNEDIKLSGPATAVFRFILESVATETWQNTAAVTCASKRVVPNRMDVFVATSIKKGLFQAGGDVIQLAEDDLFAERVTKERNTKEKKAKKGKKAKKSKKGK